MNTDVVTEMNQLWSELRQGLDRLNAQSPEADIEKYLNQVVVLIGVEFQTVYPGLEEYDDEGDIPTAKGIARQNKIQSTLEKMTLPVTESTWQAFADAMRDHLDQSPKDIGAGLEALSAGDRAELGERTKTVREVLSS